MNQTLVWSVVLNCAWNELKKRRLVGILRIMLSIGAFSKVFCSVMLKVSLYLIGQQIGKG